MEEYFGDIAINSIFHKTFCKIPVMKKYNLTLCNLIFKLKLLILLSLPTNLKYYYCS